MNLDGAFPFDSHDMSVLYTMEMGRREEELRRGAEIAAANAAPHIYACIDGTGPYSDGEYEAEFKDSFVQRLYRNWDNGARYYKRGPSLDGVTTPALGMGAFQYVRERHRHKTAAPKRVFLAGYSRGGAAAVYAASLLAVEGIAVDGLFLFDAVDRQPFNTPLFIPANVRVCFHARRDPRTQSRTLFGNYATQPAPGARTVYKQQYFFCTHGGMGGTPWGVADPDGYINETNDYAPPGAGRAKPPASSAVERWLDDPATRAVLKYTSPGAYGALRGYDAYKYLGRTRVTLAQEKAESARVWVWMSTALKVLRQQLAAIPAS
ncbi:hypothetical protein [Labrys neptuniae]